jgi:serine/threonine-protein phosphatase PGAM5
MPRRVVYLVRHGQYDIERGAAGELTADGRRQARATAQLLAALGVTFDTHRVSTLIRAQQTAEIVGKTLNVEFEPSPLLSEGFPTNIEGESARTFRADRKRFELAYDAFFQPPQASVTDLIVCHGNIIRFFVCKVLAIPVKRWIQLGTNHASVTRVVVKSNGLAGVASFNETSHLPTELIT